MDIVYAKDAGIPYRTDIYLENLSIPSYFFEPCTIILLVEE